DTHTPPATPATDAPAYRRAIQPDATRYTPPRTAERSWSEHPLAASPFAHRAEPQSDHAHPRLGAIPIAPVPDPAPSPAPRPTSRGEPDPPPPPAASKSRCSYSGTPTTSTLTDQRAATARHRPHNRPPPISRSEGPVVRPAPEPPSASPSSASLASKRSFA